MYVFNNVFVFICLNSERNITNLKIKNLALLTMSDRKLRKTYPYIFRKPLFIYYHLLPFYLTSWY